MIEIIKEINERIEVYEELQKKAQDKGDMMKSLMYINQCRGLCEAVQIIIQTLKN